LPIYYTDKSESTQICELLDTREIFLLSAKVFSQGTVESKSKATLFCPSAEGFIIAIQDSGENGHVEV
jgi:hypothetical protein